MEIMASRMETDLRNAAVSALPSPAATPYRTLQRTPSRSLSRTPSRKTRKPRKPAATPREESPSPALATEMMNKRASRDVISDENVSFLDPRRFTPTLHASLVSEILSLRRDQEEKLKMIEVLETSLQNVFDEKAGLQSSLADTSKESRSLKRQLALLEGGSTSAIGDLARERDEAQDLTTETKKRLETAQKKLRTQEEDSQRAREIWAKEKAEWAEERRKFERQIHIAESRLKFVIEEVAQIQSAPTTGARAVEGAAEEADIVSLRTPSITSSVRFSTISGPNFGKVNFTNLADELSNLDDDDQTDVDDRQSMLWSPTHRRNMSGGSISSKNHQRNFSIDSQARPGSLGGGRLQVIESVLRKLEGHIDEEDDETQVPVKKVEYVDAAVQGDDIEPPKKFEYVNAETQSREFKYANAETQSREIKYTNAETQSREFKYVNSETQSQKVKYADAAVQGDAEPKPPVKKFEYVDAAVQGDEELQSPVQKVEYVDAAVQGDEEPEPPVKKVEYVDSAVQGEEVAQPPVNKVEYVDAASQWEEVAQPTLKKWEYTDAAIQFSPPPSPRTPILKAFNPDHISKVDGNDVENSPRIEVEIEANQSRKRVHINRPGPLDSPRMTPPSMVSSECQTAEPDSPRLLRFSTEKPTSSANLKTAETRSIATQTEEAPIKKKAAPLTIPTISIVPPTSCPNTPREPLLPQYFKDAGCQVSILQSPSTTTQSSGVQTDEIRVDQRLNKLPRHLHPSTITSRPTSPAATQAKTEAKAEPGVLPPRNPRRLATHPTVAVDEPILVLPASLEDEPLVLRPGRIGTPSIERAPVPAPRSHRISSLFSTFDVVSSDEADNALDDDGDSDIEFRTALSAPNPRPGLNRKIIRPSPADYCTSPEEPMPVIRDSRCGSRQSVRSETSGVIQIAEVRDVSSRRPMKVSPIEVAPSSQGSVLRRTAMIQSSNASHQAGQQSPGLPEIQEPPFPIPTRASSRQPAAAAANAQSEAARPLTRYPSGRSRVAKGNIYRSNSIRKVRSATSIPKVPRRKSDYATPPASPTKMTQEGSDCPPLPVNDITRPRSRDPGIVRYKSQRSRPSTNRTSNEFASTISTDNTSQPMGVVDAIAQTMVGEWMFKYVRRRRKSFGVDGGGRDDNGNDRHKRWVWLAPYEQAILWSSKQPVSGSALMGKSGRKLTIKSVLDVKDDNPIPKGETQIFNRSILILTPQRALKFTASTSERHYMWIMALTFLAHSSQAVPQIASSLAPPKPAPAPDPELAKGKLKRGGIRDSIRLTKGRNATLTARQVQPQPTLPEAPEMPEVPDPIPTFPANIEVSEMMPSMPTMPTHQREPSEDPAQPPMIRRFNNKRIHERANQVVLHGRKRSNTGGHVPPPLSFRGFSGSSNPIAPSIKSPGMASIDTTASSDIFGSPKSSKNMPWGMRAESQRAPPTASRPTANFFEAIGTVRMEAFINPMTSKFDDQPSEDEEWQPAPRQQTPDFRRRHNRSRQQVTHAESYGIEDDEEHFRDDPFGEF